MANVKIYKCNFLQFFISAKLRPLPTVVTDTRIETDQLMGIGEILLICLKHISGAARSRPPHVGLEVLRKQTALNLWTRIEIR